MLICHYCGIRGRAVDVQVEEAPSLLDEPEPMCPKCRRMVGLLPRSVRRWVLQILAARESGMTDTSEEGRL